MSITRLILSLLLTFASVFSAFAGQERVFRAITSSDGLSDNSAQTLKCTKTGRMTITTLGNVTFYDGAQFNNVRMSLDDAFRLENYQGHYHLYYDAYHHLWLKGSHNVNCVNLTTEHAVINMDSLFLSMGMKEKVYDLFVDVDGEVWFCGKDNIQNPQLGYKIMLKPDLNLQDLEVLDKNELFLLYDNGLLECYDVKTGKKKYENRAYGGESAAKYHRSSVLVLRDDGFYQARNGITGGILLSYDTRHREWTTLMESEHHLNGLALYDKVLYVAAQLGYFTYDLQSGAFEHVSALKMRSGRSLYTDINAIEFDRQGGMWIGTETRGLLYARPLNTPFASLPIEGDEAQHYVQLMSDLQGISEFNGRRANVMFIDSRRWTWVGTSSALYLYKSPQDEPIVLSRSSGLLNNVIHGIIEDDFSNIWISTSNGITCLQVADGNVKYVVSFNQDDNVPGESFVNGKVMKLSDGSIVMQAIDHVLHFNPKDFKEILSQQPYKMFPKLTGLMVNGTFIDQGMEVNGSVILQKAITRTKEINLNYDQNSLSLTFSALNFARPLQTFYRVRIKELDEQWKVYSHYNSGGMVDRRGLFHLPLVSLSPGTYHIELQASNVIDKFEGEPYSWVLNINEPWWRASGMVALLAVVLLTLVFINFYLYNRNTRLRIRRNNDEGNIVSRIKNFIERCDTYEDQVMAPLFNEDGVLIQPTPQDDLSPDFVEQMLLIMPYVKAQKNMSFTMHGLVQETGVELSELYKIITSNLHKNPRTLVLMLRLKRVQDLLSTTDKTVEAITDECLFSSPNFLISSFYHHFKMTPKDYRLSI